MSPKSQIRIRLPFVIALTAALAIFGCSAGGDTWITGSTVRELKSNDVVGVFTMSKDGSMSKSRYASAECRLNANGTYLAFMPSFCANAIYGSTVTGRWTLAPSGVAFMPQITLGEGRILTTASAVALTNAQGLFLYPGEVRLREGIATLRAERCLLPLSTAERTRRAEALNRSIVALSNECRKVEASIAELSHRIEVHGNELLNTTDAARRVELALTMKQDRDLLSKHSEFHKALSEKLRERPK